MPTDLDILKKAFLNATSTSLVTKAWDEPLTRRESTHAEQVFPAPALPSSVGGWMASSGTPYATVENTASTVLPIQQGGATPSRTYFETRPGRSGFNDVDFVPYNWGTNRFGNKGGALLGHPISWEVVGPTGKSPFTHWQWAVTTGTNTLTLEEGVMSQLFTTVAPHVAPALARLLAQPESPFGPAEFTFADLFAGIGGMRLGFEAHGGRCVFTSEWNRFSQQTYRANFPDEHEIFGDITKLSTPSSQMPDFDVLLAGFPCQPFSIAGVSKKNALGRPHGFACEAQGTLFFDVARILEAKRPKAFLLENVKNLLSHDRGNTFRVIRGVLERELGYTIHCKVIDAQHFVPQHRERIMIVGFRQPTAFDWADAILPEKKRQRLISVLHSEDGAEDPEAPYTSGTDAKVASKYTLTDHLWRYLRDYAAKHRAAGNGFGYGLVGPDDVARTLSARYYKDGSEILVDQGRRKNPRRLTPRECARLMGYPDTFRIPVSDTQAYKQFGNSVAVPVIREVARLMKPFILNPRATPKTDASWVQLNMWPAAV